MRPAGGETGGTRGAILLAEVAPPLRRRARSGPGKRSRALSGVSASTVREPPVARECPQQMPIHSVKSQRGTLAHLARQSALDRAQTRGAGEDDGDVPHR